VQCTDSSTQVIVIAADIDKYIAVDFVIEVRNFLAYFTAVLICSGGRCLMFTLAAPNPDIAPFFV